MDATDFLSWFEAPRALVEPMVAVLRAANTAVDTLFYDVGVLAAELRDRGATIEVGGAPPAGTAGVSEPQKVLLDAVTNPEGSILVIDPQRPPFVTRFADVEAFASFARTAEPAIRVLSVTGVGSSAFGSAAFAWNIAVALGEPIGAIVPGYGVADIVEQACGGWFGFGLHGPWVKQTAQYWLAMTAPGIARIGRELMMTAPGPHRQINGAPVFERGSGSSDVLHALLRDVPGFRYLFGHSKGALVIENAILDIPAPITEQLHIVTFGCPIVEDTPAHYRQFLGCMDWLGLLNSWGNRPEWLLPSQHSTNTYIPLSMPVTPLAKA